MLQFQILVYYFKYHLGEKETVKIMNMFYVTQKVLGEIVLYCKRKATKNKLPNYKLTFCAEKNLSLIFFKLVLWSQTRTRLCCPI